MKNLEETEARRTNRQSCKQNSYFKSIHIEIPLVLSKILGILIEERKIYNIKLFERFPAILHREKYIIKLILNFVFCILILYVILTALAGRLVLQRVAKVARGILANTINLTPIASRRNLHDNDRLSRRC